MANMTSPAQVMITGVQDKVIPVTFSISGSTAAYTVVNGTMYPFGFNNPTTATTFQVPAGSKYQLVDVYVSGSPTVDGQLVLQINGITQGENLILSTLNSTNNARVKITQGMVLEPTVTLTVQVCTLASSPTSTSTDTVYLHFIQVPA
jgi:hypothetical protein